MTLLVMLAISLLATACREEKVEGILPKGDMVKVLSEIYLAEDKVNRLSLAPDSSKKVFAIMRAKIAEETGIPDSVFLRSMQYYTARPEKMERIYSALVDSLMLKEQRLQVSPEVE